MTTSDNLSFSIINPLTNTVNELFVLDSFLYPTGNNVVLNIKNMSSNSITLKGDNGGNPNKNNYSLALTFPKGLFDATALKSITVPGNSNCKLQLDITTNTLYFLFKSPQKIDAEGKIELWLYHLKPQPQLTNSFNMELKIWEKGNATPNPALQTGLSVLNHTGIKQSPFKAVIDTPLVKTTGESQVLTMRLINITGQPLNLTKNTQFQISFDVQEGLIKSPESLVTKSEYSDVKASLGHVEIIKTAKTTKIKTISVGAFTQHSLDDFKGSFTYTLSQAINLKNQESLKITFNGLVPYTTPGISKIAINYSNLNGYWDGVENLEVRRTAYYEKAKRVDLSVKNGNALRIGHLNGGVVQQGLYINDDGSRVEVGKYTTDGNFNKGLFINDKEIHLGNSDGGSSLKEGVSVASGTVNVGALAYDASSKTYVATNGLAVDNSDSSLKIGTFKYDANSKKNNIINGISLSGKEVELGSWTGSSFTNGLYIEDDKMELGTYDQTSGGQTKGLYIIDNIGIGSWKITSHIVKGKTKYSRHQTNGLYISKTQYQLGTYDSGNILKGLDINDEIQLGNYPNGGDIANGLHINGEEAALGNYTGGTIASGLGINGNTMDLGTYDEISGVKTKALSIDDKIQLGNFVNETSMSEGIYMTTDKIDVGFYDTSKSGSPIQKGFYIEDTVQVGEFPNGSISKGLFIGNHVDVGFYDTSGSGDPLEHGLKTIPGETAKIK